MSPIRTYSTIMHNIENANRPFVRNMVFLFDSSGTENAEAGSGMGVELLVDFGVGDVGKVLG